MILSLLAFAVWYSVYSPSSLARDVHGTRRTHQAKEVARKPGITGRAVRAEPPCGKALAGEARHAEGCNTRPRTVDTIPVQNKLYLWKPRFSIVLRCAFRISRRSVFCGGGWYTLPVKPDPDDGS